MAGIEACIESIDIEGLARTKDHLGRNIIVAKGQRLLQINVFPLFNACSADFLSTYAFKHYTVCSRIFAKKNIYAEDLNWTIDCVISDCEIAFSAACLSVIERVQEFFKVETFQDIIYTTKVT